MNNLQETIKSKQIHYLKDSWFYLETKLIKICEELIRKLFDERIHHRRYPFTKIGFCSATIINLES